MKSCGLTNFLSLSSVFIAFRIKEQRKKGGGRGKICKKMNKLNEERKEIAKP
jgi:hypothetical protein